MKDKTLPTAEETLKLFPPVPSNRMVPNYYHHETVVSAIESHAQAHTKELRERVKELEDEKQELLEGVEVIANGSLVDINNFPLQNAVSFLNIAQHKLTIMGYLWYEKDGRYVSPNELATMDSEKRDEVYSGNFGSEEEIVEYRKENLERANKALKQHDNETDNTGD